MSLDRALAGELANALKDVGSARAARDSASETRKAVDRGLAEVHARELRGWARGLVQSTAQCVHFGVSRSEALLQLSMVPRHEHDEDHSYEQQCDRRQDSEDLRRCFHG